MYQYATAELLLSQTHPVCLTMRTEPASLRGSVLVAQEKCSSSACLGSLGRARRTPARWPRRDSVRGSARESKRGRARGPCAADALETRPRRRGLADEDTLWHGGGALRRSRGFYAALHRRSGGRLLQATHGQSRPNESAGLPLPEATARVASTSATVCRCAGRKPVR
jgi:hypothetical protein